MYSSRIAVAALCTNRSISVPITPLSYAWRADINLLDQLDIFGGQLYFRNYEA